MVVFHFFRFPTFIEDELVHAHAGQVKIIMGKCCRSCFTVARVVLIFRQNLIVYAIEEIRFLCNCFCDIVILVKFWNSITNLPYSIPLRDGNIVTANMPLNELDMKIGCPEYNALAIMSSVP